MEKSATLAARASGEGVLRLWCMDRRCGTLMTRRTEMSSVLFAVLQHQSHDDIPSSDPLDGIVYPRERHDFNKGLDALHR